MEWISVEDRLPDSDEQVLVYYHRQSNDFRFYGLDLTSSYGDLENDCWFHCQRGDKVTHWAKLTPPAPPKTKEEPKE
jgi:Protein of unknown function (DUF551)